MESDADRTRLEYRSGRDARLDDAQAMRRSLRTWAVLSAVWALGVGVWAVYLAVVAFLFLRLLS